jgi:hypothetical protein
MRTLPERSMTPRSPVRNQPSSVNSVVPGAGAAVSVAEDALAVGSAGS